MRQLSQCHTAGVAAYQQIHFFIGSQLFDSADAGFGVFGLVCRHEFKLAAQHTAFFINFVDRHLDSSQSVSADLQLNGGRNTDTHRFSLSQHYRGAEQTAA